MAHAIGTVVIWLLCISVGLPLALMVIYRLFQLRRPLLGLVLASVLIIAVVLDPVGFLVLSVFVAAPFAISRLRAGAWSLDDQVKMKVKADRESMGYGSNSE